MIAPKTSNQKDGFHGVVADQRTPDELKGCAQKNADDGSGNQPRQEETEEDSEHGVEGVAGAAKTATDGEFDRHERLNGTQNPDEVDGQLDYLEIIRKDQGEGAAQKR